MFSWCSNYFFKIFFNFFLLFFLSLLFVSFFHSSPRFLFSIFFNLWEEGWGGFEFKEKKYCKNWLGNGEKENMYDSVCYYFIPKED